MVSGCINSVHTWVYGEGGRCSFSHNGSPSGKLLKDTDLPLAALSYGSCAELPISG